VAFLFGPAEYVIHPWQSPVPPDAIGDGENVDCAIAVPLKAEAKNRLAPSNTKIARNFIIVVS
jgi:hypothetical protein